MFLLNLSNALYFLGGKHCGFGPQVHTQLNTVGGGSGGTYSNATCTQPNDTMKTWAIPSSIVPTAALWLWCGLRLYKHFLWIRKHDLVKTQTGFNLPAIWTAEPKENQPLEDSWFGAIHFLLKMILHPEREDKVPVWEGSAQIQICGWTTRKTHFQLSPVLQLLCCLKEWTRSLKEWKNEIPPKKRSRSHCPEHLHSISFWFLEFYKLTIFERKEWTQSTDTH